MGRKIVKLELLNCVDGKCGMVREGREDLSNNRDVTWKECTDWVTSDVCLSNALQMGKLWRDLSYLILK